LPQNYFKIDVYVKFNTLCLIGIFRVDFIKISLIFIQ
jgi:hypothetical protein